jgi:signal peptidase II
MRKILSRFKRNDENRIMGSRTFRLVALLLVLVGTAGCDQAAKHIARSQLSQLGSVTLPGAFLQFTLTENPGAFLGLGASLPQVARNGFAVSLGAGLGLLLVYLARAPRLRLSSFLALGLVWAGGVSNLLDRFFRHGLVTDFMVLRAGPLQSGVFNLADLAIVVGALVLFLSFGSGFGDSGGSRGSPSVS